MIENRSNTTTLSVLTFNCWLIPIPYSCKDYKIRMRAIQDILFTNSKFDVICLQEIWGQNLFEELQEKAKGVFKYWHYFHSGVLGSGVCIFSRWPIVEAMFHKWQVNGYVHKLTHGDWYGGKGIGFCRLNVNGFKINLYTCHTHAEYNNKTEYIAHQVVQAFDVAQFIRVSSSNTDLSILAADLNTEPGSLCYRIITEYAQLHDSFQPENVIFEGTYGRPDNSYSKKSYSKLKPAGQRIDYILFKIGKNISIRNRSYCTPLQNRIPEHNCSYSDHEAVLATFELTRDDGSGDFRESFKYISVTKKSVEETISEAYHICTTTEENLRKDISSIKRSLLFVLLFLLLLFYLCKMFLFSTAGIILMIVIILFILILYIAVYLWKSIERNGILCALKEMKISLDNIQLDE